MSFARKPVRPSSKRRVGALRPSSGAVLRVALLAFFAIAGAAWALVRHYTHTLPPLLVPVGPVAAPPYDPDAGEMPVPELLE